MPLFVISVKGQTSQDDIFGDFDENANFDDFTPDMSKPSDDFLAQMLAIGRVINLIGVLLKNLGINQESSS